ncbi:unnamed protein product [Ranitomeya imitator]|uniref:Uncharacterized protein n=1 Tax=Ranitomeya imitator TaxID=111125 RepID=A0ABN9MD85_9NEOB|nr:unnamed protein product [Ranitomeya imitator]
MSHIVPYMSPELRDLKDGEYLFLSPTIYTWAFDCTPPPAFWRCSPEKPFVCLTISSLNAPLLGSQFSPSSITLIFLGKKKSLGMAAEEEVISSLRANRKTSLLSSFKNCVQVQGIRTDEGKDIRKNEQ